MGVSGAIDGIISGFDTTAMIDAIMRYESQRADLITARKTEQTNKLTTWKSIEAMLTAVKIQAGLLSNENLWYAKAATSSNEDAIAVTSTAEATPGTYFLNVNQLATHHQIASQGMSSLGQSIGGGSIEIKVGNSSPTVITVDSSNNTLSALKDAINNSGARVTAAIINDGSEHNPYRLVLTAKDSGAANQISVTSTLSGSVTPQFEAAFDWAEQLSWADTATSNPVRSNDAVYTGTTNKTYTFTVGGAGLQTVGAGDIEVEWTDGTNSGTITVTAADTDIELTGDGADGLSVYFSAGALQAGDTFQIQAFAPTIQSGQDAIVELGSSGNGGSPITLTSATNTISDLIAGVTLQLKSVNTGSPIEISVEEDRSQIKTQIQEFVKKYNDFQNFVDKQFTYTEETKDAGVLLGDTSLMMLQNDLRTTITRTLTGRPAAMRMLSQAGVRFASDGKLSFDESVFNKAIEGNYLDMVKLFRSNGTSSNVGIEYLSAGANTEISTTGYEVNITQAATRGSLTGNAIPDPAESGLVINASNNILKLKINNRVSGEIALTQKTYTTGDELAGEIENAINSDSALAGAGVQVEWVDDSGSGHLVIYSGVYGSGSTVALEPDVTNSAYAILGLSGGLTEEGQNVEGTINGESATGVGQFLTGDEGNDNTAGLKLLISLTPEELQIDGAEGTVYFNKGVASILNDKIGAYTDPYYGLIKSKKDALQSQIDASDSQIEAVQAQLERKRADLYRQFTAMEQALGQLQAQQQYLSAAISQMQQVSQAISSNNSNN